MHLSSDIETARRVGARRGRCAVLVVQAGSMHRDGHLFSVSDNGVWLTKQAPARYLSRLSDAMTPGSGQGQAPGRT